MKNMGPLPLYLCDMQGQNELGHPLYADDIESGGNYHDAGPYNGLHLVKRGAPDPHLESGAPLAAQRSRLGKAVDVMLGRADVRPSRTLVRQSWRA